MFARTQRLTLRPGWPEDAAALTQAIAHEGVAMKLARLPWPYTRSHAEEWLARSQGHGDESRIILAHRDDGEPQLIGAVGIHPAGDGTSLELGYWLTPDAWGRGYATEAGRAMLGIARYGMGLRRLVSGHFLDNPASGRVLTKLGFRRTGEEMRHCVARGQYVPCALMEIDLAEEDLPADFRLAA